MKKLKKVVVAFIVFVTDDAIASGLLSTVIDHMEEALEKDGYMPKLTIATIDGESYLAGRDRIGGLPR